MLVPTIVAAVALAAVFARSREPLRRFAPAFALLAAGAIAWVALRAVEGGSWREVLGAYGTVAEQKYSLGLAAKYVAWHVADAFLLVLGVPLLALTASLVPALRGREADAAVRAFLAVAIAYVALLVVEVGVFASRFVGHLAERQLVTAAPPLFLALALWLHRGAPRPQPWTSVAAVLVAVPVVLLPVGELVDPGGSARRVLDDSAGAPGVLDLGGRDGGRLRRRRRARAAALRPPARDGGRRRSWPRSPSGLVGASVVVASEVSELSRRERLRVFGAGDPRWIDRAADGPVSFLWVGERFWPAVWEHLFWNRRIGRCCGCPTRRSRGPCRSAPSRRASTASSTTPTGREVAPDLLVASRSLVFAGERVAELPATPDHDALVLWRPEHPLRISTWATGILPNGDLDGPLARPGLRLRPRPARVDADRQAGAAAADPAERAARSTSGRSPPARSTAPSLPAPADARGDTRCVYEIESDGLVGSTRVEFVREP